MSAPRPHVQRIRAVIALSAGLTLLVACALGWLGWRVISQERALDRQRQRERLEQMADAVVASVQRTFTEVALRQGRSSEPAANEDPAAGEPVRVRFDRTTVHTDPPHALLYYPAVAPAGLLSEREFIDADRLEFQEKDDARLLIALRAIAGSSDGITRAEALLRLARVQARMGQSAGALATYETLAAGSEINPRLDVPYALLAGIERCRLFAAAKRSDALAAEADRLRGMVQSGSWQMRRASYIYYDSVLREIAAGAERAAPSPARLAITEAVNRLWDDWHAMTDTADRHVREWVYPFEGMTLLVIGNAAAERLDAQVFTPDRLQQLVLGAISTQFGADRFAVGLLDEGGSPIFGDAVAATDTRTARPLTVGGLTWQIWVSAPVSANPTTAWQARYLAVGLAVVVLIVGAACYAMARGVILEWRTSRLQSDFVSAVSHEFRSPLTTLVQLTELLAERRIRDESRRQTYFEVLQKETLRLQRLVESLLDFGRMEANRREYAREPIDFAELVRGVVHECQRDAATNGFELNVASPPGTLAVLADREAMSRVVRNLIENAMKYSPICRTVWIETAQDSGAAVLAVRDRGMGIAPAEQPRIFDKFVRGEAAKHACIQGTGIGLAMVKEVVKAHDGDIGLVSEVGVGSTFTIRLPLIDAAAEAVA